MRNLTASPLVGDPELAIAYLHRLRDAGFSFSLDNFSTSYSSPSYLHSFPIDALEMDW